MSNRNDNPVQSRVIYGIDVLRFISAAMVMLFHLTFWIGRPHTTPNVMSGGMFDFGQLAHLTSVGRMGVEIFFVISGFVIAFSAQRADAGSFLRGRILRLAPGAWVCATASLVVACMFAQDNVLDLVSAWVRSISFSPYGGYIDGVYWTLAIEVSFYLLMLGLIYFDAMRHIDAVFLGLAAVSTSFCVTIYIVAPQLHGLAADRTLQLALIVHGAHFAVGVLLWRILYVGSSPMRWAGLAIGLVGGGLETAKFVTERGDRVPALALWLAAIALIVLSVRCNERFRAMLDDRGCAVVRAMGLATFPLYLLHQLIGAALMGVLARLGLSQASCLMVTLVVITAAAFAVALRAEPVIRDRLRQALTASGGSRPVAVGTPARTS